MPLYEIMCITTLQSSPQQLVNMLQRLAVVVNKGKGVFRRVEHLGTRPLAYRMKAHMKYNTVGRFIRLYIQASPLLCRDVEARLRVDDHVVRTLTLKHQSLAPVSESRRQVSRRAMHPSSTLGQGVMQHDPAVEYYGARALLMLGLISREELLSLQRFRPDARWDAIRHDELLKAAQGGSEEAAKFLQLPVPSRSKEVDKMRRLAEKEERVMQRYEAYRRANNQRKLAARAQYDKDEEEAAQRRREWYYRSGQAMRDRKVAKKRNKGKKVPREQIAAFLQRPLSPQLVQKRAYARFVRQGRVVDPPEWARKDEQAAAQQAQQASEQASATSSA